VNPQLPSAAGLIDSFLKDLQGIASLFSNQRERDTFTVHLNAASGSQQFWTVDADCTLIGCYYAQGGGSTNIIARSNVGNIVAAGAGISARKIIAFFTGTTVVQAVPFLFCRESFRVADKVWLINGSASTTIVLLVFES
jgi:hypothetical protein